MDYEKQKEQLIKEFNELQVKIQKIIGKIELIDEMTKGETKEEKKEQN